MDGSPVVIVTWESYAVQHNIRSWSSVHRLAEASNSDLKFAHTDPQLSNSGYMAALMEVSAAAGYTTQNLTYEDLLREDVRSWLKDVESRAVMYGESTGFLADQATNSGPQGLNVFIVYENLVIEKNMQGEPMARWGQKLIAVYPKEGVLVSDHPFCILNAPWVSEEQREAAEEFYSFLMMPEILTHTPDGFGAILKFAVKHKVPIGGTLVYTADRSSSILLTGFSTNVKLQDEAT